MESRRWTNPGQPQTLQIAVFLLYINAAFSIVQMLRVGLFLPILLPILIAAGGSVAGGYGTANEKKWGYALAVAVSVLQLLLGLTYFGLANLIGLMFDIALVALLLHPQSRDYQRIWFK